MNVSKNTKPGIMNFHGIKPGVEFINIVILKFYFLQENTEPENLLKI